MGEMFHRNTKTVKDVYDEFLNEKLIVDNSYQRRKVWMLQDKVRLIETILLDLVMPEVFFWPAEIHPDTGDTLTHIVDGQQRITSIVEFISGEFALSEKYLIDEDMCESWGNKTFSELSAEEKSKIWTYNISIVNINKKFTKQEITQMFYRLNLTNYTLNAQERLNSKESVFGDAAEALSTMDFWKECRLFSASDARRMQDVRYCCSIYILANEGIVDQTNNKKIEDYHKDFSQEFDNTQELYNKIEKGMEIITSLKDKTTASFISKKAQMYSLFCCAFKMLDNNIEMTNEIFVRFKLFVKAYNLFRNEYSIAFNDENLRKYNEYLKQYKLASSEGINKLKNRVIRLEILYKICVLGENDAEDTLRALEKLYLKETEGDKIEFEQLEIDELIDMVEE